MVSGAEGLDELDETRHLNHWMMEIKIMCIKLKVRTGI
jgi:hypothetical protein